MLAFSVDLKDCNDRSLLALHVFNFKSNGDCFILQDGFLPQCTAVGNIMLIGECFWTLESEREKKQQTGSSALLGNDSSLPFVFLLKGKT